MSKPKSPTISKAVELEQLRARLRAFETEMMLVRRDAATPEQVLNRIRKLELERDNINSQIATLRQRIEQPEEVCAHLERNAALIRRKLAMSNPRSPAAKHLVARNKLAQLADEYEKLKLKMGLTDADIEALLSEE